MTTNPSDVSARLRKPDPYIALPDEDRVKWQYPTEALRLEAANLLDSQAKLLAERDISIKPLEWDGPIRIDDVSSALTPFGSYRVWGTGKYWFFDFASGLTRKAGSSRVEAFAAAQGDYERRIRFAIALPSPPKLSEPT